MSALYFHKNVLEREVIDQVKMILEKSFDMIYEDEYFTENENYVHFYSVEDGKVASYLTYEVFESTIYNVCTSPDQRRKGYAKDLLEYALNVVDNDTVYLYVDEWNTGARRLYEKIGFRYLMSVSTVHQSDKETFEGQSTSPQEVELFMKHTRGLLKRLWRLLFSCKN